MKISSETKDKAYAWFEQRGPICAAVIFTVITLYIRHKFSLSTGFDKVLDATVVFSSIMVGFIGVLMGVLFSIRDTELIKLFFKSRAVNVLKKYFYESIVSSISLVTFSIILYLRNHMSIFEILIYGIWSFLLMFTFLSFVRIIHIIFHIVFSEETDEQNNEINMEESDKNEFRKRMSKQK